MIIKTINKNDPKWNEAIEFADKCSWRAGPFFAKSLKNDSYTDWERVFIAQDNDHIVGYCTFSKKDCIETDKYTPFIGFIFVDEKSRGNRISQKMIDKVLLYAKEVGFHKVYIVSGELGLYEKYGFTKIDEMKDKFGNWEQIFCIEI